MNSRQVRNILWGDGPVAMVAACILWPVSVLYSLLPRLRAYLFQLKILKSVHLPGITISVGNLTVGGAGKSPLVIAICRELAAAGHRPAIVTRGYGAGLRKNECLTILDQKIVAGTTRCRPDEAFMQSAALPGIPVIVGARRTNAVARYLAKFPDSARTHFIIDDGFQHLKISRQLDLVVIDDLTVTNRRCLPAGPLREPVSALKRADLLLMRVDGDLSLTSSSIKRNLEEIARWSNVPAASIIPINYVQSVPTPAPHLNGDLPSEWSSKVLLLAGIARPERLVESALRSGVVIFDKVIAPDHNEFKFDEIRVKVQGCSAVLTSPKDYWRNPNLFSKLNVPTVIMDIEVRMGSVTMHSSWFSANKQP